MYESMTVLTGWLHIPQCTRCKLCAGVWCGRVWQLFRNGAAKTPESEPPSQTVTERNSLMFSLSRFFWCSAFLRTFTHVRRDTRHEPMNTWRRRKAASASVEQTEIGGAREGSLSHQSWRHQNNLWSNDIWRWCHGSVWHTGRINSALYILCWHLHLHYMHFVIFPSFSKWLM